MSESRALDILQSKVTPDNEGVVLLKTLILD